MVGVKVSRVQGVKESRELGYEEYPVCHFEEPATRNLKKGGSKKNQLEDFFLRSR